MKPLHPVAFKGGMDQGRGPDDPDAAQAGDHPQRSDPHHTRRTQHLEPSHQVTEFEGFLEVQEYKANVIHETAQNCFQNKSHQFSTTVIVTEQTVTNIQLEFLRKVDLGQWCKSPVPGRFGSPIGIVTCAKSIRRRWRNRWRGCWSLPWSWNISVGHGHPVLSHLNFFGDRLKAKCSILESVVKTAGWVRWGSGSARDWQLGERQYFPFTSDD